jgi:hypothetical protein
MANPLYTSAAEVIPVQPTTRFFDPGESLGIMQRYGMSAANRAFAEDALKSANEIDKAANYDPINRRNELDRHGWAREIKDREDQAHNEKKEFETTLGEFLTGVAAVSPEDPDFDNKMAGFLADPAAANHEAVKAIYNLKVGQREMSMRERQIKAEKENTLEWKLAAEAGVDPTTLYTDGKLDIGKTAEAIRTLQEQQAQAKAQKDRADTLRKSVSDDQQYLFDLPSATLTEELTGRIRGLVAGATEQDLKTPGVEGINKLLTDNPALGKNAFIAQVLDLGKRLELPEGDDREARLAAILNTRAELPEPLKPLVRDAERVWDAHHARRAGPPPKSAAPSGEAAPDTDAEAKLKSLRNQNPR